MVNEDPFEDVAAIAHEVKAIRDLDRIWRSLPRTTRILATPVAAYQLWLAMRVQPRRKCISSPCG